MEPLFDFMQPGKVRPRKTSSLHPRTIRGVLVNQTGEPQSGRMISARGGGLAITREDGTFSIQVFMVHTSLIVDETDTYKGICRKVDHPDDYIKLVLHVKKYDEVDIDRLTIDDSTK